MAKYKVVTPKGASFTTAGGGYDIESEALIGIDAEIIEAPADEAGIHRGRERRRCDLRQGHPDHQDDHRCARRTAR